ncbi:MAG: glycosyltransferase family 39 protein [Chloroflexota bacterium]
MNQSEDQKSSQEPNVLDYFISKIKFWEKSMLSLAESELTDDDSSLTTADSKTKTVKRIEHKAHLEKKTKPVVTEDVAVSDSAIPAIHYLIPWLSVVALVLAVIAQMLLEPSPNRSAIPGLVLYLLAAGALIYANIRREWVVDNHRREVLPGFNLTLRIDFLFMALIMAAIAFILFGNGHFTFLNTVFWLLALIMVFLTFRDKETVSSQWLNRIWEALKYPRWRIEFSRWTLILLVAIGLVLFFRFNQLDTVPPEMISDQAERLFGVNDVVQGEYTVFFAANFGSEAFQFYWTGALIKLFGLDISFYSLKLASVLAGLITLIYIYLLGKEIANKWTGLLAMVFCGIAYWPNVFTRAAMGAVFFPLILAPLFYYLLKGLRISNRNYFLYAGLALGLGLLSYRAFLIVPVLLIMAVVLYCLHKQSAGKRAQALFGLVIILLIALIIFLPLLRTILAEPRVYLYRIFSRLSNWERPLPGSGWSIFLKNLWSALVMFFWSDGNCWVDSIIQRPALDFISSSLYFIGLLLLIVRYIRNRHWLDMFLIVSIPILLLPSVLSLAFPEENPSLSRTAGVIIPVFLVIGLALDTFISTLRTKLPQKLGKAIAWIIGLSLVILSSVNNYDLVFNQYTNLYQSASWNASEMAAVIEEFNDTIGSYDSTWIVGYPHWVDTRLVAIEVGRAGYDFAIWPEQIEQTTLTTQAKMFLININDESGKHVLEEIYPDGVLWEHESDVENKNFMIFFVPPSQGVEQ